MTEETVVGDFRDNRVRMVCKKVQEGNAQCRLIDKKTNEDIAHFDIFINDPREKGSKIGSSQEVFCKGVFGKIEGD